MYDFVHIADIWAKIVGQKIQYVNDLSNVLIKCDFD